MIYLTLFSILISCYDNPDEAFKDFNTAYVDTIRLDEFQGISYYSILFTGDTIRFDFDIVNDTVKLLQLADFSIAPYDFQKGKIYGLNNGSQNYLKDFDGDGFNEIIICCISGGNHCCEDMMVYSLQNPPILRSQVHTDYVSEGRLKDLDEDSIPEYIWTDTWFDGWKTFNTAWKNGESQWLPELIWKWDVSQYRIANYQFLEFYNENIRQYFNPSELPKYSEESRTRGYDSTAAAPIFPPPILTSIMLNYYYAGQMAKADSIFNDFWPTNTPGKSVFYRDFENYLISNTHWPDILKSEWR
jgi:hypothetical protein